MMRLLAVTVAWLGLVSVAGAVPIVYQSELVANVPVNGVNNQGPGNSSNPVGAVYYSFYSDGATPIEIIGDRQAGHYDMSAWIFSGLFADTNAFGASFDVSDPGFEAFIDDDDSPNIPGPFGDPHFGPGVLAAGAYTVAVTNFLSGAGGPPNPFTLTAIGVVPSPEPASLLGWALLTGVGIVGYRLRRRKASA